MNKQQILQELGEFVLTYISIVLLYGILLLTVLLWGQPQFNFHEFFQDFGNKILCDSFWFSIMVRSFLYVRDHFDKTY